MLTKSTCLMEREFATELDGDITQTFRMRNDDDNGVERTIEINNIDWVNMGSPEVITVTVEPGDKLNLDGVRRSEEIDVTEHIRKEAQR